MGGRERKSYSREGRLGGREGNQPWLQPHVTAVCVGGSSFRPPPSISPLTQ